jgi:hypothetical protein
MSASLAAILSDKTALYPVFGALASAKPQTVRRSPKDELGLLAALAISLPLDQLDFL